MKTTQITVAAPEIGQVVFFESDGAVRRGRVSQFRAVINRFGTLSVEVSVQHYEDGERRIYSMLAERCYETAADACAVAFKDEETEL